MARRFTVFRFPVSRTAPTAAPRTHGLPFDARSVLLFSLLTFGIAAALHAQPASAAQAAGTPDVGAVFQRADADRDGRLSRSEADYLPTVARYFDRIDTDRDGSISLQELTAAVKS
ncbi:hypothetical protein [uncultured Xylophilus sp.]|uniref:hypothetical protein n=1 Tax=uncultured Xylophilus sp. TaxID=296832 RepID=UPI0025E7BEF4|nr:hypothetical protein [uncultured Xylophilus sp.]